MDLHLKDNKLRAAYRKANPVTVAWAIARRHIKESLRNRSTYVMAAFYLLLPLGLVLFTVRPLIEQAARAGAAGAGASAAAAAREVGGVVALYMLMAGLLPSTWSVGIASGAFAAEKEQGSLVPLLATPASNASIFGGKVLGAVLPALTLAAVGVIGYLAEIALFFGPRALTLLPPLSTALIVALLPAVSLLGAALSSMISARVNTEQVANQYGSIILTLLWVGLFVLVLRVAAWGIWPFAAAVLVIYLVDLGLVSLSAATWRREEVMARR